MGRRANDPSISGVLLIDKPAGMTSHDVVGRVRKALGMRRVGHAGTLDPMATGVLVIGVGPTTRLLGIVGGHDKEYTATIRLGASTTTDDREGEVLRVADPAALSDVDGTAIARCIASLTGEIEQRPSAVSAVKIDGRRAYERVRSGEDVDLPARQVRVSTFEVLGIEHAPECIDVRVRVECSAGTYIRALARDLGECLGVGGHLTALRRTRSGHVTHEQCRALDDVDIEALLAPGDFARQALPFIDIEASDAILARNGVRLELPGARASAVALIGPGNDLVAVVDASGADGRYTAVFPAPSGAQSLPGEPAGQG